MRKKEGVEADADADAEAEAEEDAEAEAEAKAEKEEKEEALATCSQPKRPPKGKRIIVKSLAPTSTF